MGKKKEEKDKKKKKKGETQTQNSPQDELIKANENLPDSLSINKSTLICLLLQE